MIVGIGIGVIGYAIFYWGIHHFPGVDGGQRYSLIDVLGIPQAWGIAKGTPVGLNPGGSLKAEYQAAQGSQQQNSNNTQTPSPMNNSSGWQTSVLQGLGAPITQNNINKMNAWNACEGNLAGHSGLGINNPFNTTLNCCNGTSVNSAGVKSYPTMTAGIQATIQTLSGTRYFAIVQNLMNDGSFTGFATAVGSSPWGTSGSCIGGKG